MMQELPQERMVLLKVTELVASFAEPVIREKGCTLWDVEYVREGSEYFLRLYIDKEGGVDIDDCEAVSRAMDPILDEKDPIPGSYHFEVCSAGLERALKRPKANEFGFERTSSLLAHSPEMGMPEDIANAALFLASDESHFINGTIITCDGGWTCF